MNDSYLENIYTAADGSGFLIGRNNDIKFNNIKAKNLKSNYNGGFTSIINSNRFEMNFCEISMSTSKS